MQVGAPSAQSSLQTPMSLLEERDSERTVPTPLHLSLASGEQRYPARPREESFHSFLSDTQVGFSCLFVREGPVLLGG